MMATLMQVQPFECVNKLSAGKQRNKRKRGSALDPREDPTPPLCFLAFLPRRCMALCRDHHRLMRQFGAVPLMFITCLARRDHESDRDDPHGTGPPIPQLPQKNHRSSGALNVRLCRITHSGLEIPMAVTSALSGTGASSAVSPLKLAGNEKRLHPVEPHAPHDGRPPGPSTLISRRQTDDSSGNRFQGPRPFGRYDCAKKAWERGMRCLEHL